MKIWGGPLDEGEPSDESIQYITGHRHRQNARVNREIVTWYIMFIESIMGTKLSLIFSNSTDLMLQIMLVHCILIFYKNQM